ncbi:hypothetical protein CBU02nite_27530 [Clostridium butyricum]|uniref:Uncharacterized protein n=1 Tax=Clostridium butyricum TaxID=1492 RepID=A0A512TPQ9_CLOBU|nr:hypothetical protein [Clostridium butyricum]MDU6037822.1 hypothetical protein [Clostridium butyricum]NOW21782.1 hypothetical protein [Clostridium butyricum]GEQ22247.1 hypothetical protein CBU02nite_27530 [Clostridium butyricum]
MTNSQKQVEVVKKLLKDTFNASAKANEILFKNYLNKHDEFIASIFLNKAIAIVASCKAIYYSNLENLEDDRVENIFSKFDIFNNEFLNNISTGHSHQWTDIEFNSFKDSVAELLGEI